MRADSQHRPGMGADRASRMHQLDLGSKYIIPDFVEVSGEDGVSAFSDYQVGVLRNLLADRAMLREKLKHILNRIKEMESEKHGYHERLEIVEHEIRDLIFEGEHDREHRP